MLAGKWEEGFLRGGKAMTAEEAKEAVRSGKKVKIFLGGRLYEGNLFFDDSGSFFWFVGRGIKKPSEQITARVFPSDLSRAKMA